MKLIGYTFSRPFGGFIMPVPAQNSCLREYASKQDALYQLPQLEHKFENCFMQLFTTIKLLKKNEEIVIYSVLMMPTNNDKINKIFIEIKKRKSKIHFVLENKIVKNIEEYNKLIFPYKIKKLIQKKENLINKLNEKK